VKSIKLTRCFGKVVWYATTNGKTNDNPKVHEFLSNSRTLQIIDSINAAEVDGKCQGTKRKHYDLESVDLKTPLKMRRRHVSK